MSEIKDWIKFGRELLDLVETHYGEDRKISIKPEKEKDPHVCEPSYPVVIEYSHDGKDRLHILEVMELIRSYKSPTCKCGAKIKATGWEKV